MCIVPHTYSTFCFGNLFARHSRFKNTFTTTGGNENENSQNCQLSRTTPYRHNEKNNADRAKKQVKDAQARYKMKKAQEKLKQVEKQHSVSFVY
jgi:hypothetical protein